MRSFSTWRTVFDKVNCNTKNKAGFNIAEIEHDTDNLYNKYKDYKIVSAMTDNERADISLGAELTCEFVPSKNYSTTL